MFSLDESRRVLAGVHLVQGLGISEVRSRLRTGARLAETGQRILAFYLADLALALEKAGIGQTVGLEIQRGGRRTDVEVVVQDINELASR